MDVFRKSSSYSIPVYFKDQANDLKNIEAEANRALQNIKSLYEEIMYTDSVDNFELENNIDSVESPSSSSASDKLDCSADTNKFTNKSSKFYCHSQLPLAHCSHCHERCFQNNTKSRHITTEEETTYESETHLLKDNARSSKSPLNVTVPQPFSLSGFDERRIQAKQLKLAQIKKEKEQQIEKEMNVKVSSKPAPKHTHLHLYDEMVKNNERRKNERKEQYLKVVGKASNPSPLNDYLVSSSKIITTSVTTVSESKSRFKATPVPKNILSNKVSEKIKNKEEVRKMLMAHRAEEMLKQSSSPLSKKTIPRSYSMLNLSSYNKETVQGSKPNITAITNRLYSKKYKKTMDNWNNKVMRYCHKENESKSNTSIINKLKPQPEQLLPFLYYPVRMSTTTSLRNKLIRTEILAREQQEKQSQNSETNETKQEMHEEISKKLQTLIPVNDAEKEIEERVKNYRESQTNREVEYERELEEIMKRVSQQYLLLERQSQKGNNKTESLKGVKCKKKDGSSLNSDTDTKSHLEEKEPSSELEQSEDLESYSE